MVTHSAKKQGRKKNAGRGRGDRTKFEKGGGGGRGLNFLWDLRPYHRRTEQIKTTNLDLIRCIALLSIPFHPNPINYFKVTRPSTNQPRSKCDTDIEADFYEIAKWITFEIRVEQFKTCTGKDFEKVMALIRFFYLFNVEYRSIIESKLSFIQKFFLNINDKSKTIDKCPKLKPLLKKKFNGL